MHFTGRQGTRVKVRGHSVDLVEIEAALAACPGVAKAAVVASAGTAASAERLTAYLVVPADHRVELAPPGEVGEVPPVALQDLVLLLGVLVRHALTAPHLGERRQDRVAL